MTSRYKKILRDLTSDLPKNLLLVAAIAIGVFGIGTVLGGYAILKREMASNYLGTNPAAATIELEGASLSRSLVDSAAVLEGIVQAERHATIVARMKIDGAWYPMLLFVVDDFQHMKMNTVTSVSGARVPAPGTMLAERTAHRVMSSVDGSEIIVKTPNGSPTLLRIAGTVHDPGLAPAWQEKTGYGYITLETLHMLGETQGFDELRIAVPERERSHQAITQRAKAVGSWLERKGFTIHEVQIPPPLRHPHQGQMNAVLLLFTVFSFLLLGLSAILVSTSIAALMVKQIREIGIMKTIGGTSRQISLMYIVMIGSLCVVAAAAAIPLSRHAALLFAEKIALMLNLNIADTAIPTFVPLVQAASGILIPLLAASVPVLRGSRITVRKAMDSHGVAQVNGAERSLISRLTSSTLFGETFALSMRNVFRSRSRLLLSLALLSVGGAMFMTALNVSKAWDVNLQKLTQQRLYDLDLRFSRSSPADDLTRIVASSARVSSVEPWLYSTTSFVKDENYDIVQTYPDRGHGSFLIVGIPLPTTMMKLPMFEGAWLNERSGEDVVLNHMAHALSSALRVGDSVALSIENTTKRWRIVGFAEDLYSPATAYVPITAFRNTAGARDMSNMLRLRFVENDARTVADATQAIEEACNSKRVSIFQCVPVSLFRNAIGEHMGVLVSSLIAMAVLMALVGTLGLTSTMSINVMERTREIGVMRAIGATPGIVRKLVLMEGLAIGTMSIFFAIGLSFVMSTHLGQWLGTMAFRSPLSLAVSVTGIHLWIAVVLVGSFAATVYPARRASAITPREALSYE